MQDVSDDSTWLFACDVGKRTLPDDIIEALKADRAVLLRDLTPEQADGFVIGTAEAFGLRQQLEIQAGFASLYGHRRTVGANFMTVNQRNDYEFITPHSEGTPLSNVQLAGFYCFNNTTDGGSTILFHVNNHSPDWERVKEIRTKIDLDGRELSVADRAIARMRHGVRIPEDILASGDEVVSEEPSVVPGTRIYSVLARPEKIKSVILSQEVNTFWDSVGSIDRDCAQQYHDLLGALGLLRLPPGGAPAESLDHTRSRKAWNSGLELKNLFRHRIHHKMEAGDFILINNTTWAHSVTNWTPGSGQREVVAAFA